MKTCGFYGGVLKTSQGSHVTLQGGREDEGDVPDSLNRSSEAILTDMSWEKRSFWERASVSGRLLIGSLFSLAPKVLKASR